MTAKTRIDHQPAYVLHSYPYSETSLIVDVFSRDHGRLPLLARGARRPRAALRGLLQAFQPLELAWFGSGEVRTLAKAEWQGGLPLLSGKALLLGFYLNELLLKLLPRDDAHERLFDSYTLALQQLARLGQQRVAANMSAHSGGMTSPLPASKAHLGLPGSRAMENAATQGVEVAVPASEDEQPTVQLALTAPLRQFEKNLLQELGYGLQLQHEALTGEVLQADRYYDYQLELGPVAAAVDVAEELTEGLVETLQGTRAVRVRGKTLQDLATDSYHDPLSLLESRQLMRQVIQHQLGVQVLQTRRIFFEMQR